MRERTGVVTFHLLRWEAWYARGLSAVWDLQESTRNWVSLTGTELNITATQEIETPLGRALRNEGDRCSVDLNVLVSYERRAFFQESQVPIGQCANLHPLGDLNPKISTQEGNVVILYTALSKEESRGMILMNADVCNGDTTLE
jgi:hypothetical protein